MDLVTVAEVKTRMALPTGQLGADATIESALIAAENYVVSVLGTTFNFATQTDTFQLALHQFPLSPNDMMRMRLKKAFVKTGTVTLTAGAVRTDLSSVPITDYSVDYDKGLIYIADTYIGQYVAVTYTAGIETRANVPKWLKEAILAYVPGVLNVTQITNREAEHEPTLKASRELAGGILAPNLRGRAFHYTPIF